MSRFWHILGQVALLGLNGYAVYRQNGQVGGINAGLAAAQAVLGVVNQHFNTDGTPQSQPFDPPKP